MDNRRIEWTPLALYTLATGALAFSCVAWWVREGEAPQRIAQTKPAEHQSSRGETARRAPFESGYRPALNALRPRPADYVRAVPLPLDSIPRGGESRPVIVLAPSKPLWTATDTPVERVPSHAAKRFVFRIGESLGEAYHRITARVTLKPLWESLAGVERTPGLRSIGSPSPPVLIGPGDRLAMAPIRGAGKPAVKAIPYKAPRIEPEPTPSPASVFDSVALREQIQSLLALPEAQQWAEDVLCELDLSADMHSDSDDEFIVSTYRLSELAVHGRELADKVESGGTAVLMRKASYAIDRRATTWRLAKRVQRNQTLVIMHEPSRGEAQVSRLLRGSQGNRASTRQGHEWRRHLLTLRQGEPLDVLHKSSASTHEAYLQGVLDQLLAERSGLPINAPVPGAVASAGSYLFTSAPSIDVDALLVDLELYEREAQEEVATRIAQRRIALERSAREGHRRLASRIEQDYRNANFRLALSRELLRRQLPADEPKVESVSDIIAGAPVRGRAHTRTNLNILLTPDPQAWRLTLEATGLVESRTVADGGPARLHTRGAADFVAHKPIAVLHNGVLVQGAECTASSRARLVGVRTDYDGLPIVEGIIRSRAQDEYRNNARRAKVLTESRINQRVSRTLDQETSRLIHQLEERYQSDVVKRAASLGMRVEPIELRTTDKRLIARLRLAGEAQLASHTPRSRAPSDSLASLQLHESVLNNALAGLDLGREPLTPEQLELRLREKLRISTPAEDKDAERDATLTLSSTDPVRVKLQEGRIAAVLSFRELRVDRSRFRNFKVHAYFAVSASTDGVWLTQTDPVQIEGRMRAASRANLHGVFGKVMPAGRRFSVATTSLEQRRRLAGLMVTQVVIDDGWLGMALGPQTTGRVAMKERNLR